MPRPSKTSKAITIYPSIETARTIERLAAADKRSASNLIVKWIEDRIGQEGGKK